MQRNIAGAAAGGRLAVLLLGTNISNGKVKVNVTDTISIDVVMVTDVNRSSMIATSTLSGLPCPAALLFQIRTRRLRGVKMQIMPHLSMAYH
jgi:hypothetical protein